MVHQSLSGYSEFASSISSSRDRIVIDKKLSRVEPAPTEQNKTQNMCPNIIEVNNCLKKPVSSIILIFNSKIGASAIYEGPSRLVTISGASRLGRLGASANPASRPARRRATAAVTVRPAAQACTAGPKANLSGPGLGRRYSPQRRPAAARCTLSPSVVLPVSCSGCQ